MPNTDNLDEPIIINFDTIGKLYDIHPEIVNRAIQYISQKHGGMPIKYEPDEKLYDFLSRFDHDQTTEGGRFWHHIVIGNYSEIAFWENGVYSPAKESVVPQTANSTNSELPMSVEFPLNHNDDSDESKVKIVLYREKGGSIRWYDCSNSAHNRIPASMNGLKKLERMKVAIEIMEKHIKNSIELKK
jgi:hypothetical protein